MAATTPDRTVPGWLRVLATHWHLFPPITPDPYYQRRTTDPPPAPHPFRSADTAASQCIVPDCWGWRDDPRHWINQREEES